MMIEFVDLVIHFVMVHVLERYCIILYFNYCIRQGPDQCHECNTNFFVNVSIGEGFQCLQKCITDTYLPHNRQTGLLLIQ